MISRKDLRQYVEMIMVMGIGVYLVYRNVQH